MKRRIFIYCALFAFTCVGALGQSKETPKGSILDRIQVNGFATMGYEHNFVEDHNGGSFYLRLAELVLKGDITDKWRFGVTTQLNSPMALKDLYMCYSFSDKLNVKIGQFKTPFTLENQIAPFLSNFAQGASSSAIYFNGIGIDPLCFGTSGRDIGLEVNGKLLDGRLAYRAMLMNGQSINNRVTEGPRMHSMSLGYTFSKAFDVYTSYIYGKRVAQGAALGVEQGETYSRFRYSIAARENVKHARLMQEFIFSKDKNTSGFGGYTSGVVSIAPGIEAVAAWDGFMPDFDLDILHSTLTFGGQYWFGGRCRLQLQYHFSNVYKDGSHVDGTARHGFITQAQFVF